MKTINDWKLERKTKEDALANLVSTRSGDMDQNALSAMAAFKSEIEQIDMNIAAINELRSVAQENAKPAEKKAVDAKAEFRSAFGAYARGKITGKELEKRAGLVSTTGDIVPDEFLKDLQETILEYGVISPSAKHISTQDNGQISIPVIDDTANAGAWTAEAGAIGKADFSTSTITLDAFKVTTGIQVSSELLEDSFFNLESYLANAFGTRLARTMENAYIFGDGSAKPTGIAVDAGTKSAPSAAAGIIDIADIKTAVYELQPTSRVGANIYVSDDLMKNLSLESDTAGRPLLQAQAGATPADPVRHYIDGYPVIVNYELQDVGAGNVSCVIGNPSNYMIRDVRSVKVTRDEYSDMGTDMVNFYATARVDGKIVSANDAFVKITVA